MSKTKKWKCTECQAEYLVWQGICSQCNKAVTIEEVAGNTTSKKAVRDRWKRSERGLAKDMSEADGSDPKFKGVASSTGRVGFITGMRIDTISRSYVNEDKNQPLPKWIMDAWILVNQRAIDFNKHAQLRLNPPNLPKVIRINGKSVKTPAMSVITYPHHLELVKQARVLNELQEIIFSDDKYQELQDHFWRLMDK